MAKGAEEARATDYRMTNAEADELKGISLLPADMRILALRRYAEMSGTEALINLFAQFIGLANSVVANQRECIELFAIVEGGIHPYQAEKYNLPTIVGALFGIELANAVNESKTCGGCAYRLGTPANQSPVTTCDAASTHEPGETDFMCHEEVNSKGHPIKRCRGYAQLLKSKCALEVA